MNKIMKVTALIAVGATIGGCGAILGISVLAPRFGLNMSAKGDNSAVANCAWRYFAEGDFEHAYALAEKGDQSSASIQYIKGYYHETRNEFSLAVDLYRESANQGFVFAMWRLACCYRDGRGVANDGKESISWAKRAGEAGYVEAMVMVAQAYSDGTFVQRSMSQAISWWMRAADKDNADAQYHLAYAYETGNGINRDIDEAAKWYDRARINGRADAADGLARMRQAKRNESWTRFKQHLKMLFV